MEILELGNHLPQCLSLLCLPELFSLNQVTLSGPRHPDARAQGLFPSMMMEKKDWTWKRDGES